MAVKFLEDVGAKLINATRKEMVNAIFAASGRVVIGETVTFKQSMIDGVSNIELLKSWGMKVSERRLSVDELKEAYKDGRFTEMFGSGTAAVISPVGLLRCAGVDMELSDGKIGALSQKLYDELTGIQWGTRPDPFGWSVKVL